MIKSIYEHMEKACDKIPKGCNVKVIFRHSIRYPIKDLANDKNVKLTNEGINLALFFGRGLNYELGFLASSSSNRCKDTLKHIKHEHNSDIEIVEAAEYLTVPHVSDRKLSNKTFKEYQANIKDIIFDLKHKKELEGFMPLEDSVKKILNFIFLNGGKENTADLFCTHDFQMAMLYSVLFGFGENKSDFENNTWPMMLEGMILWGERNNFFVSWRGVTKNFVNYY